MASKLRPALCLRNVPMSLQQAQYSAEQYALYASRLPEGEAKQAALSAAQWWTNEAHRLAPPPPPPFAYAPPLPKKNNAFLIFLAIAVPLILIPIMGAAVLAVVSQNGPTSNGAAGATQHEYPIPPFSLEPQGPGTPASAPGDYASELYKSTAEEDWRSGATDIRLPDDVGEGAPSKFLKKYPDAYDFVNRESLSDIRIVYTDDSIYNCGWKSDNAYGGCYNPDYKDVIFLWWNDYASEADKAFLAAHELSHYLQWKNKFDLMYSAFSDPLVDYDVWYNTVETDATCRVLSWGGYDKRVANYSSSPCEINDWHDTWLEDQAADLGVVVEDW